MANTATALEPDDWPDEPDLADIVPFAVPQAASRTWVLAPSTEEVAELRKQIAIKITAAKMLNERVRKLTAENTAKDRQIAELDAQLLAIREDLAHRENENRSLQTSLDLSVVEGARLSGRLWDSGVESDTLRTRLDTLKAALLASEAERDRLKAVMREASNLHRIELDALARQYEALTTQNAASEAMLVDARKSLAARTEESNEAKRKAADMTRERDAATAALAELRDKLKTKNHQVRELDESRTRLMTQTGNLLEAFETRTAALAEAEAKANALARQVNDSAAKAALAHSRVDDLTAKLQSHEAALSEAAEAVQSLAGRVSEAETKSHVAQSEAERLVVKMRSHETALAEASDAIQMLAERAAAAEAEMRTAQDEAQGLSEKVQSQEVALAAATDSTQSLAERAAAAEARASTAESRVEGLSSELQQEQARRAIAEVAFAKVQTESVRLRRQVETLTARSREFEAMQTRAATEAVAREEMPPAAATVGPAVLPTAPQNAVQSLLAATISL